ncbi:MAG TPA: MFS transporter [Chthonomonadaceae bacterium]|nr:MFS transporter [Chthonomonadaceae bacterium]
MNRIKQFGLQTFSALKIRNYRLYFTGQGISLCGTWMQSIGQSWLVLKLSGSGTTLGLVTALQTLPVLLLGPWGGLVADRFRKRSILFCTQSGAALLALILGILVATHVVQVWMVCVLATCLGLINTVDNPTRQTFVMEMVGKEYLTNAITLNSSEINVARVIGPAIAGALIARAGMAPCFFLNALSYLAVLWMLFIMRVDELQVTPPVARAKGQLQEGFRYVLANPLLRTTLLMMAIIGTLTYEFQVSLPLLAQFTFHGNAATYAALTSAMGGGAVLGGLLIAGRRRQGPRLLVGMALLFGLVILIAALAPTLHLAVLAMIFVGVFSIAFTSLGNSTLQLNSAPEMRGRVMSLWTVAFLGSTPIGGPIIGWLGEHVGPRWCLMVGGLAALAAGAIGGLVLRKESRAASVLPEAPASALETDD